MIESSKSKKEDLKKLEKMKNKGVDKIK